LAPGNRIDFLCRDQRGDLVVVELKKRGADQTIGQLARYITDVRELKTKSGQKVRGVVLAQSVDEQLIKAARAIDIDVACTNWSLNSRPIRYLTIFSNRPSKPDG
jgi:RecB family endonuclease NucS